MSIFDFGLQDYKLKIDAKTFKENVFVVAGDTARRVTVQLLDSKGVVKNATGLTLRLNGNVAGRGTYTDGVLTDAAKGIYQFDLSNGMFLAPGNWDFQWLVLDQQERKLHSAPFKMKVEKNISEGGTEATNFYFNAQELKDAVNDVRQLQTELINEAVDAAFIQQNVEQRYADLEAQYATELNAVSSQLAETETLLDGVKVLVEKPYKENMLYSTNFQNVDNWSFKMTDGLATTWAANNNKLNTPSGIATDSLAYLKTIKPSDFRMSCTINGTFSNWFGLAFRINDVPTRPESLALLFFQNNSTASVWKVSNNNISKISGDFTVNRGDVTLSKGFTVELELVGNTVKFFVNDSIIGTHTHSDYRTFANGYCGLISSKDNVNIQYSDFNVYEKTFNTISLHNINKVICVGSSITNGYGATKGWRVRFQEKISALLGKSVSVINGGINGSNTTDMLSRLTNLINSNADAKICFVETSINDCKVNGNIPITTTIQNLRNMIKMCKEKNIIPILMTATPVKPTIGGNDWSNDSWQQIREMNNLVRRLSFEEKIKLVDNGKAFGSFPYNDKIAMIPDELHPNDNGSEVMALEAIKVLTS